MGTQTHWACENGIDQPKTPAQCEYAGSGDDAALALLGLGPANPQFAPGEINLIPAQQPDFGVSHASTERHFRGNVQGA